MKERSSQVLSLLSSTKPTTPRGILLGNMTGAVLLLAMNAVCWSAEGVCDGIDREVLVQIGSEYFSNAYYNLDDEVCATVIDLYNCVMCVGVILCRN